MMEHEDIRRQIDSLPGIKESELGPCGFCKSHLGLVFYRVGIEQAALQARAVERQMGLGAMLGSAHLARIMGPDEDMAKVMQSGSCLVCGDCAEKMPILALLELAADE